jgi:hypothetical protein
MDGQKPYYLSFLLRLWQVTSRQNVVWRVSLENVRTGERRDFADLASLFAFLEAETSRGEQ